MILMIALPRPAGAAATASLTQVSARLQQVADLYAADTDARVTILNPLGNAVADSATSFDTVPNQLDQAEVQAALNGLAQRAVRADPHTGEATLYVATLHPLGRPRPGPGTDVSTDAAGHGSHAALSC